MYRVLLLAWFAVPLTLPAVRADSAAEQEVASTLDTLHEAAARADYAGYIALFTEDAVFLGTDREEYWPIATFRTYVQARFSTGTGWTYVPVERFIHIRGDVAWFEERVVNARYGQTRGTGVLIRQDTADGPAWPAWKVAQYNLTLPIPNALFDATSAAIKAHYELLPQPD